MSANFSKGVKILCVAISFFVFVSLSPSDIFSSTKYVTVKYHTQKKVIKKKVKFGSKLYNFRGGAKTGYSFVAWRTAGVSKYKKNAKCKRAGDVYGVYKDKVNDGKIKIKVLKTAKALTVLKYYAYKLKTSKTNYGVYVKGIDGKNEKSTSDNSGYFWMFYDNNSSFQTSVDKQTVKKGHYIIAKYERMSW